MRGWAHVGASLWKCSEIAYHGLTAVLPALAWAQISVRRKAREPRSLAAGDDVSSSMG